MIELYTANTPNGQKIPIMLEEAQMEYKLHLIDLKSNRQKTAEFLRINPNGKIPAIVDTDNGSKVFESGAILIYLGDKYATNKFLPQKIEERAEVMQWLMFQMSALAPIGGQAFHFLKVSPEKIPYAIERFTIELQRIFGVLNAHLEKNEYLAKEYSIADMATFPWIRSLENGLPNLLSDEFSSLKRYSKQISERTAVQKALKLLA